MSQLVALIAGGLAVAALAGWATGVLALAGWWRDYMPMAPSTALGFLALSGAVFSLARWPWRRQGQRFAAVASGSVILLALMVLLQLAAGVDLQVERALSRTDDLLGGAPLGRMSSLTAASFVLLGAAVLFHLARPRWRRSPVAATLLAAAAVLLNFTVLLGYAYGAPLLYGGSSVPVALPTSIAFVLLGTGLFNLAARGVPLLSSWSGASMRGRLLRAFLPAMLLLILVHGWLEHAIERSTRLNPALTSSLMALAAAGLIVLIAALSARRAGADVERAVEALRRSEENFRRSLDESPLGIRIMPAEGGTVYANRAFLDIIGYGSLDEYTAVPVKDRYTPESYSAFQQREAARMRGAPIAPSYEVSLVRKDGGVRHVQVFRTEIRWNGRPHVQHACLDITERKAADMVLRESERRYRSLFENMLNGYALCEMVFDEERKPVDFVYIDVNDSFERLTGLKKERVIGRRVTEAIPGIKEQNPEIIPLYGEVALTGKPVAFEVFFKPLEIWLTISVFSPRRGYFVAVFDNITARKQAEEALRRSEENFRRSLDESPLGTRIVTPEGETLYVNPALLDLFGRRSLEEFNATPPAQRYTPASHAEQEQRKEKRRRGEYVPSYYDADIARPDGEVRHLLVFRKEVLWNGVPHFQLIYEDATERRRMQEQLMAQDRLASIGQLTSGVAHELSNPLTIVLGFTEVMLKEDHPDDVKKNLEMIHDGAIRASRIVKDLLTFARRHPEDKQPVNINDSIQRVLGLRDYEQRSGNIKVACRFAPDLPAVVANPFQLQQVFLNIILNAEDSMVAAYNAGTLTVVTRQVGRSVRITFSDDGAGIAKEHLGQLFTPFFTTKEVGKGTGLGLSICHGIVTAHGGRIYAESEPGKGATFIVELPVEEAAGDPAAKTVRP